MVKNKKALILLLVFLAFFNRPVYPRDKSIKYLPSSQDIEMVSKDYFSRPIVLSEIDCFVCSELFDKAYKCNECLDLKELCPDCCLTAAPPRAIKCSQEDVSGDYACTEAPFKIKNCAQTKCDYTNSDDSCTNCGSRWNDDDTNCYTLKCSSGSVSSGSPYGLQNRGCPDEFSDELAPKGCYKCVIEGIGSDRVWTCSKTSSCTSSSLPSFQSCSEVSGPPRCDGLASYYVVTDKGTFYSYGLSPAFKACIDACTTYADDYEKCRDRVDCCKQAVCETGYKNNCTDASCTERLTVSPACYKATAGRCARLNQEAQECLEGGAGVCFSEIDSNTRYDFVARTGEAYNVVWQINTAPIAKAKDDENTKFYTMVKVVDPNNNKFPPDNVVYSSNLHQKSLNAAFSIYGTTLISKDTFSPGKSYQIQVHYFMNDNPDTDYKVKITHMSLIVTRVRE